MEFKIINKVVKQNATRIGVQGENGVEVIDFVLEKNYDGIPLLFYQINGVIDFIELEKIEEQTPQNEVVYKLRWIVGSQVTATRGILTAQIKISNADFNVFKTEKTTFFVADSLPMDSPQEPIFIKSRYAIPKISNNDYGIAPFLAEPIDEPEIFIIERDIIIPSVLQNIAVQTDNKTETIKIRVPRYFDGHDLSKFTFYMDTISSGGKDTLIFVEKDIFDDSFVVNWTLKSPQTSYSGKLSIQIYFADADGRRWATKQQFLNILPFADAKPIIPVTPSIIHQFLKDIAETENKIKISESNAKKSEINAKNSENNAKQSEINTKTSENNANDSATKAKISEINAKNSENNASNTETRIIQLKNQNEIYSDIASTSANNALQSANNALQSETNAKNWGDMSSQNAKRAKDEADRAEREADRALNLANLFFLNPRTGEYQNIQNILIDNFNYLFDLIRKLHQLGLSWEQIHAQAESWANIETKKLTWSDISVLGINIPKMIDIAKIMRGDC